jgi:hypothetical protein
MSRHPAILDHLSGDVDLLSSVPYSCMIRRCIPLALFFSRSSSTSREFTRWRVAHSRTKRFCIFPPKWHQFREFIQNESRGSIIPIDKFQTNIQERPDLQLCLLCHSQSSKKRRMDLERSIQHIAGFHFLLLPPWWSEIRKVQFFPTFLQARRRGLFFDCSTAASAGESQHKPRSDCPKSRY